MTDKIIDAVGLAAHKAYAKWHNTSRSVPYMSLETAMGQEALKAIQDAGYVVMKEVNVLATMGRLQALGNNAAAGQDWQEWALSLDSDLQDAMIQAAQKEE